MRIVVRQTDGLGNQLFQYAAGRYYQQRYDASLRVASELPSSMHSAGIRPRPLLLDRFAVRSPIRQVTFRDRVLLSSGRKYQALASTFRSVSKACVLREEKSNRYLFRTIPEAPANMKTVFLVGYWQMYPIVQEVEETLRSEFRLKKPAAGRNAEVARLIANAANPVSLHIRRGDYIHLFGEEAVLSRDYYECAMKRMLERLGKATFFVFSDDSSFARQWIGTKNNCLLVDHNDESSAHEDLRLMSACRHHIIANSTFSWWGAWLNPRTDKTVCVPSDWLGWKTAEIDIAPPNWSII